MKLAVVGCGYWGPNLVRNLVESQQCDKVVCCDLNPHLLKQIRIKYPSVDCTTRYAEILADPAIVGVLLATPITTHYPLARQALEAGKHTFVEKPLATKSWEAQALVELAEVNQLVLMVGHTFEYSPPVIKIKQILDRGEIGDVLYLSSSRVNLGLHQKDVSVIWDLAPHDFSILCYWLEQTPRRVTAIGRDFVQKGIPDVAFITLEFPQQIIAHVHVSWLAPSKLRRTTIIGNQKMIVYDDTESLEKVKIFDKGVDYRDPETFGEYQLSYRTGDIISPVLETYEPLALEIRHFIECIQNGRTPRTDGYNGLRVVRILEAAERSMQMNGTPQEVASDV